MFALSQKSGMYYFTLSLSLSSHKSHFKGSIASLWLVAPILDRVGLVDTYTYQQNKIIPSRIFCWNMISHRSVWQEFKSDSYFHCGLVNVNYCKLVNPTVTIYALEQCCLRQSRTVVFKLGYWCVNSLQEVCNRESLQGIYSLVLNLHMYFCLKLICLRNRNFPTCLRLSISPGWCGSVDWAAACKPKGQWFDSCSGHMPGLQARSLHERQPIDVSFTHQCFSLSLFLPPFPSL